MIWCYYKPLAGCKKLGNAFIELEDIVMAEVNIFDSFIIAVKILTEENWFETAVKDK